MKWLFDLLFPARGTEGRVARPAFPRFRPCLDGFTLLEERTVPSAGVLSSDVSNFNGTAIAAGDTVWFSAVFKAGGVPATGATLYVTGQTATFTANGVPYSVAVPDSTVVLSPKFAAARSTFDGTRWTIDLPTSFSGNGFLGGVALPVPGGLPGGIQNVDWQGTFGSDTPGVSVHWQWAAAAYTTGFSTADAAAGGVKSVDDNHADALFTNSDHAGTPEAFKAAVTGGARGGGGSNWTGSYSSTVAVVPPVVPPPVTGLATLSGNVYLNGVGAGASGVLVTITDAAGNVLGQTTTAGDGSYTLTNLPAGSGYVVSVTPRAGTSVIEVWAGTDNGTTDGADTLPTISGVTLQAGDAAVEYNFLLVSG